MDSLLNPNRPPVFCPGCAHDKILHTLDQALVGMGYSGESVVIVSDIGCSGLFDTFFNTHAFHGLHGRALTYATGIKMARPELTVIVTMGDGGLGIGGAHVLGTCRRNIDITLLVLNNFNYGMTGGQYSSTTPQEAQVSSGFLNRLEKPMDICLVASASGAAHVARASSYSKGLVDTLKEAIQFNGFSLVDIWGICPGRYTRRNTITPKQIEADLSRLPDLDAFKTNNDRPEYGAAYRREAALQKPPQDPVCIEKTCTYPQSGRQDLVLLGGAGQRIITAGELLCLAGAAAGLHTTQKNDYPITVMRGHSISEIILSEIEIEYTGIENPSVIIALAQVGTIRRMKMIANLSPDTTVIKATGVDLPANRANIIEINFNARKLKSQHWALAALAILAQQNIVLSMEMLYSALNMRFKETILETAYDVIEKATG